MERFLAGLSEIPTAGLHGVTGAERTPTFAIDINGLTAAEAAMALGKRGVFVSHGHYYAVEVMQRLGVLDSGGLVRIGFVHYNTLDEIDRVVDSLARHLE